MSSWDTITAALEEKVGPGRPAGQWTKYCCPAHEGDGRHHKPSLGVKYDSATHRSWVKCFAGCDDRDVLDKLGLKVHDLFDTPLTRGFRSERAPQPRKVTRADRAIDAAGLPLIKPSRDLGKQVSGWKRVAVYPYTRADGTVAGEVTRKEARFENGRDKQFFQRRWNPGENRWERGGFDPIPFQLPRVLAAIEAGETVYIVEGEKDVLTAERAGLTATCNAGSAWTPEHARWLDGAAEVVIVADRDAPGYRRAGRVLDTLTGVVDRVRVVQAATGKDLTDHIDVGHGIDELEPVPYLDPEPTEPEQGGTHMGELSGLGLNDHVVHHDDTVDHLGMQFSKIVRLLMEQMMQFARTAADRRRRDAEEMARRSEEEQQAHAARQAAERKAVETRLAKMRETGWERASRGEIAAAVRDSAAWADESPAAKKAFGELAAHVHGRWGVEITDSGDVAVAAPELAGQLAAAERDRATTNRLRTAQDRMVEMVAGEDIDESAKAGLYAEIEAWRQNPNRGSLNALTAKLQTAGIGEQTRTKLRFVAVYLTTENSEMPPMAELRRLADPLVDPGEEAKPRVDDLLQRYQDRLRHGVDTNTVATQLSETVKVMTAEDQQLARERGVEIRKNPAAEFKPLWPDHVDRDHLAGKVHMFASLAPDVEARVAQDDGLDADWQVQQRDRVTALRRDIDKALTKGKGLHDWEKDQLRAVLADVEAGKSSVPDLLFADDRSAAVIDRDRSDDIARETARHNRRELEEILSTAAAPTETVKQVRDEITSVAAAQTSLAAGRTSLRDFEESAAEERLIGRLAAAGVPEPVRNRVQHHLDDKRGDAAITGHQARRIAEKWADRRGRVVASRKPQPVAYDSPERRDAQAKHLRAQGLSEPTVAGRMAADAGHAQPPQAAVNTPPSEMKGRRTTPGKGIYRATHRGRGDQRGYGK